jgi:hypothetical protein
MNMQTVKDRYQEKQEEIAELLKQIQAGLEQHNQSASNKNWCHVGDLTSIAETLTDIRDRLHGTGEYTTYNSKGRKITVTIPLTD